jgi:hypothetical protein
MVIRRLWWGWSHTVEGNLFFCFKDSLKTEVIRVVRLPIAELVEIKIQTSLTSISIVFLYCSPSSSASL